MADRKIFFPTDFSPASEAAMPLALSLAKDRGATLVIVHVEEPPAAYGGGEMFYTVPDVTTENNQKRLEALAPKDAGVPYELRLVTGSPAATLVRMAEEEDADLIVMGTHGRTGLMRVLMGSVAEAVVRRAKCPVLTLRKSAAGHSDVAEMASQEGGAS